MAQQFLVKLIPGTYWARTDDVTDAKLNLTANPTITVTGSISDTIDYTPVTPTTKTFTTFNLTDDILRVAAGHGSTTGQRVKVSSAGTLPGGLVAGTEYFLRVDTTNPATDFTLHYTLNGAQTNTSRVDVSSAGTGAHTLAYVNYASGPPMIFDPVSGTWQQGMVSPSNLPEYVANTASAPGVRGAVPGAPPGQAALSFFGADGLWHAAVPADVGSNLYLNENVI